MNSADLANILTGMERLENAANHAPDLIGEVEEQYEEIVAKAGMDPDVLAARNRFRIRHADLMQRRRPRVLFGSRKKTLNFHVLPLLQVADVVFVSLAQDDKPDDDLIIVDPITQGMEHVLAAMPKGFEPDLYFDYQTCALDRTLRSLECAPFPTVASLCHHFLAWKVDAIARQFDYVLPLSSKYCEILAATVPPRKIIGVPFGMAWGSFHNQLDAPAEISRPIDVLLTFSSGARYLYGPYRSTVIALFEKARERYGDRFRFEAVTGVHRDDYVLALTRARIVLNVVGVNGPYNYRSCEAANAGAVLMQYEPHFATGPQGMENFLRPDEEYVGFDETNFEAKLEALLLDRERCEKIARQGQKRMKEEYAYQRLFQKLFAEIASRWNWRTHRPSPDSSALARVHEYLEVSGTTQFLAVDDILGAARASGTHPVAFVMPLYRSLQEALGPGILADMVDGLPDTTDLRTSRLAFYDRALAVIAEPTTVDRFNHLVLSAADGAINLQACLEFETELATEPHLDHNEMARIVAPRVDAIPEEKARLAAIAVRNFGYLLAKDAAGRRNAARDFMLIWVYWLEALAGYNPQEALAAATEILEAYPLWDAARDPDHKEEAAAA